MSRRVAMLLIKLAMIVLALFWLAVLALALWIGLLMLNARLTQRRVSKLEIQLREAGLNGKQSAEPTWPAPKS